MIKDFPQKRIKFFSYRRTAAISFFGVLIFVAGLLPVFAGDSIYGKVIEVKSANSVVLETIDGKEKYNVRIIGIDTPKQEAFAEQARKMVSTLVLGRNARLHFEYRDKNGEMVGRLQTDDPQIGIKDVATEIVRAGLASRQVRFDYKYGELAAAEKSARKARRGLWARQNQKGGN